MKRKLDENDVPTPVPVSAAFTDLHLDARLLQAIAQAKFDAPTRIQSRAIPVALQGKDVLVRSKTGSGKTLAYLLPILHSTLQRQKQAEKRAISSLILLPTKELATQVFTALKTFTKFCAQNVRFENVSRSEDEAVTRKRLATHPDIVLATPSRASHWIDNGVLSLEGLRHFVIDEADLVLSYDYGEDLDSLAAAMPSGVQTILVSATLRTEVDTLTSLFCKSGPPAVLDLSAEEAAEQSTLSQYIVRTAEDEKFLLIYAIFKLQLVKGKVICFVADIDRCYRVKMFLEQFGIRSCVLNSELPVNSRLHVVEEFNKGVYDILIAADENEVVGAEGVTSKRRRVEHDEEDAVEQEDDNEDDVERNAEETSPTTQNDEDDSAATKPSSKAKKQKAKPRDSEFGVSRGIDFRHVSCVLNFDLPTTAKSYTHRIGRTARAGQQGMSLSFFVPEELFRKHKSTSIPQCVNDEKILSRIKRKQEDNGKKIEEWHFDMDKLSGFRYRLTDALRAVTRIAIREARTRELRQELVNSAKLQRHFEEHPEDLRHLRHDTESHRVRQQSHLRHVPDYLLPNGGKAAIKKDVGFVGINKNKENRLRKARAFNKARGKGRLAKGRGLDPLKSLNARGRGKS